MYYLDYQSTTPCDIRVLDKMLPFFCDKFYNAHSNHVFGNMMMDEVEDARTQVADLINADSKEIVFTSGATESNNLAIKGVFNFYKNKKNHIISTTIEHKCVLETLRYLERSCGAKVTYISPNKKGIINPVDIANAITDETLLVSVMTVNNEIGTIQQIREIGAMCRSNGVFFHTDAAQAFGKIELDVRRDNIDLMSISAHKIYGPKGVGALFISVRPNRVRLSPIMHGGGQERNFRSGTLPVPLCIGFGEAARLAKIEMDKDAKHVTECRDAFLSELSKLLPKFYINGDMNDRLPNNLNISFEGVEAESIIFGLDDIAVTSVSACSSEKLESSYVLKAIGVPDELSHSSIRIGFGRFTTIDECIYAAKKISDVVKRLRKISPLWNH